jgi:hypothetical protein
MVMGQGEGGSTMRCVYGLGACVARSRAAEVRCRIMDRIGPPNPRLPHAMSRAKPPLTLNLKVVVLAAALLDSEYETMDGNRHSASRL